LFSPGRLADTLLQMDRQAKAGALVERAITSVIVHFPDDSHLSRDLPYYEDLLRRTGGKP
jgi:hypothetical protein